MRQLVWFEGELGGDVQIVEMPTTVELLQEVAERIDNYKKGVGQSAAGREFSLAATANEDTIMRFNRGMAEMKGTRRDFDFEKDPT